MNLGAVIHHVEDAVRFRTAQVVRRVALVVHPAAAFTMVRGRHCSPASSKFDRGGRRWWKVADSSATWVANDDLPLSLPKGRCAAMAALARASCGTGADVYLPQGISDFSHAHARTHDEYL